MSRAVADDVQTCARANGDEAIAACTRAIDSTRYTGKELAVEYYNRGIKYQNKEDYDRAIADYSEAIRLDPNNGGSAIPGGGHVNRGISYRSAGQYDRSIRDYDQAIVLDPKMPSHSTIAALPILAKVNTTAPSRTTIRCSGSIRTISAY